MHHGASRAPGVLAGVCLALLAACGGSSGEPPVETPAIDDASRGAGGIEFRVLAGDTTPGFDDGVLDQPQASFAAPTALAVTPKGTWIADRDAHRLRLLDAGGAVGTAAGGSAGHADGELAQASFDAPIALASAANGDLLIVGDAVQGRVRKILTTRRLDNQHGQMIETVTVSTLDFGARPPQRPAAVAANAAGDVWVADAATGRLLRLLADGTLQVLREGLVTPAGVALDAGGAVYVSDTGRHVIRVLRDGVWSVFAGREGSAGSDDGDRTGDARLDGPAALAFAVDGRLAVAEPARGRLRWIDRDGRVSSWAPPEAADAPQALAFDGEGALRYVSAGSRSVLRLASDGTLTRLAGRPDGPAEAVDGSARPPRLNRPLGVFMERQLATLWLADAGNHAIRRLELASNTHAATRLYTEAGNGRPGMDDGPPLQATMSNPSAVGWGGGRMFIVDTDNHCIRALGFYGTITAVAGRCGEPGRADGDAATSRLNRPTGLMVDAGGGNVLVADTGNHRIVLLQERAFQASEWIVKTLAGNGSPGYADGPAAQAQFNAPQAVVWHPLDGSVIVADTGNHRLRRIARDFSVSTIAGDGQPGSTGGPALQARFNGPRGLVADDFGRLIVADTGNNLVRMLDLDGSVRRLSGVAPPYRAERPTPDESPLDEPVGLGLTSDSRVVVTNAGSNRIVSFRFP